MWPDCLLLKKETFPGYRGSNELHRRVATGYAGPLRSGSKGYVLVHLVWGSLGSKQTARKIVFGCDPPIKPTNLRILM